MSNVTNLIIATSAGEDVTSIINSLATYKIDEQPFRIVAIDDRSLPDAWYGGTKYLECNLLIGAYNYLNLEELLDFMRIQVTWEDPEDVQIIYKGENDNKFRIVDLFSESPLAGLGNVQD